MKKRLLSAALALAMVLTLLPVSAFAAYDQAGAALTDGRAVQYKLKDEVLSGVDKAPDDGWYFVGNDGVTWYKANNATSGVITGTNKTSGTWYQNVTAAMAANQFTVILIGDTTDGTPVNPASSLNVDLNGHVWTINGNLNVLDGTEQANCTSLTVKDTSATPGTLSCSGIVVGTNSVNRGKSATIELTNINMPAGDISVHQFSADNVTLTNTKAPQTTIWMAGVASTDAATSTLGTVTVTGTSTLKKINLAKNIGSSTSGGKVVVSNGASVSDVVSVNQASGSNVVTVSGGASVTGAVTVTQTSGDNVVSVSGGGKCYGGITVTQTSGNNTVSVTGSGSQVNGNTIVTQTTGGSISVTNNAGTGPVSLTSSRGAGSVDPTITVDSGANVWSIAGAGDGLKVNVNNAGKVGGQGSNTNPNVTLIGRTESTLTDDQKASLIPPVLTVNGGTIMGTVGISGVEQLEKNYTVTIAGGATVGGAITLPKAEISVNNSTISDVNLGSGTLTVGTAATVGNVLLGKHSGYGGKFGIRATMNVTGFGNTIGQIKQNPNNTGADAVKIALTIPGAEGATQNPNDNDTNKIDSIYVGGANGDATDFARWDTDASSIKGGHYRAPLNAMMRQLLPRRIAYQVKQNDTGANAGKYGAYCYSYWADSELLMNTLATLTKTFPGAVGDIIAKGALDNAGTSFNNNDVGTVAMYAYDPRTVGDSNPANNPAKPSGAAERVLMIVFPHPTGNTITSITMPSVVGSNRSITWYPLATYPANHKNPISGTEVAIDTAGTAIAGGKTITPTDNIAYVSNDISYKVTKVLNVQVSTATTGVNPTVKAKLVNGNIVLSGLAEISGNGNAAVIPLELETDAIEKVYVNATWNPTTKALSFTDPTGNYPNTSTPIPSLREQTGGALVISSTDNSKLTLTESKTDVGLTTSNLTEFTLTVDIQGNGTSATNNLGGLFAVTTSIPNTQVNGDVLKKQLADALTKPAGTNGVVDFSDSPTVQQEFGAYIAKLNQTTLNSQLKKVQTDKYKEQHPNASQTVLNNLDEAQLESTNYTKIAVVLYMQMNITSFERGSTGYTMTATMTPYARVEVQHKDGPDVVDNAPVVITAGTSLGTLDSTNAGLVTVTLPDVSGVFDKLAKAAGYAHQNSTYVAAVSNNGNTNSFTLQHTAANGAGFGTIVVNNTKYLAEVQKQDSQNNWSSYTPAKYYDTLQAAVDDVRNGEKIFVNNTASSITEMPINVTGRARTFYINVDGNQKITRANNASGVTITQPTGTTTEYTVQLTRDNVVKPEPTEKPISIVAVSVTGGSASLSATRADEGDTITVTLTPATGYNISGLTVRTNKGTTVGYTTGTTNSTTRATTYTFVVPKDQDITSVTVTPSFVATKTGISINVGTTPRGTATTSAGTNKVAIGSTVSVTTVPSTGYRTMGLTVTADNGTRATATRTGVNTYVFTVPTSSNYVTVTPTFDVNNGTVFEDVWSTEYYSAPVAWAVGRNITDGTSTYTFSPGNSCTRAQMVTFLWRAAGRPSTAGMSNPFYDVNISMGNDFYNAILWATAKGITNGTSAHYFSPNATVTRAQAVTFLWRYEGKPSANTNSGFYDVPTNEYYAQAVTWAVNKGITNGDGSTTRFNPNGACLRAQIVTFLYRDITGTRA